MNWQAATPTAGQTNPPGLTVDVDADGIPDIWELANGLDPQVNDANPDPDQDDMTNLQEYWADTDPHNPLDFLHFNRVSVSNGNCLLEFNTKTNRTYVNEFRNSLDLADTWQVLSNNIPGTGGIISINDTPGQSARFYRLKVTFNPCVGPATPSEVI